MKALHRFRRPLPRPLARIHEAFRTIATQTARGIGSPWTFIAAVMVIVLWAVTGPIYHYSDTWQLFVNTVTSVVTFLAVFLIQNTQNRDSKALHLKLDELLRAVEGARTRLVDLQSLTDDELDELEDEFRRLRERESRRSRVR